MGEEVDAPEQAEGRLTVSRLATAWPGGCSVKYKGATRSNSSHLAVHLAGHLGEGGTVSELGAPSHEGEDGFAVNEEQLPPVT